VIRSYIKAIFTYFLATASAGCAASALPVIEFAKPSIDYVLDVSDHPDRNVFTVSLRSTSERNICISVDDWPNRYGNISGGSGRAELIFNDGVIPSTDTNFGYCSGSACIITLKPNSTISADVNYAEFGPVDTISKIKNKRMVYKISPSYCS